MRLSVILFFFAVCFEPALIYAAPSDTVTVSPDENTSEPPANPDEENRLKSMDITVPEKTDSEKLVAKKNHDSSLYYYPYRQSISPRLGFVFDPDKLRENFQMVFLFGFHFMWPSDTSTHWETGIDIHTGGTGYLQLNRRWIFKSSEKMRPFLRAGLTMRMISEQGFASIVNQDNVQLRVGAGFEDLIVSPVSAAVSMEISGNAQQAFLAVCMGYSWAW